MKSFEKIFSLMLIIFCVLSLSSCYLLDDSYTEIWSCIDEFDIPTFDSDEFLADLQADSNVSVEEQNSHYENIRRFIAVYGDRKVVTFHICEDADSAREFYKDKLQIVSRIYTPYWSLVRVNNVVFEPLIIHESNDIMPQIMSNLGIENSHTLKVYTKWYAIPSSTDKSLDEIVAEIESRGYVKVKYIYDEEDQIYQYSFVSEDGTDMYEILACSDENSENFVWGYLDWFYEMVTEDTVTRIYYSFNDGYSMIFFGNSIETRNFWNEIR